MCTPSTAGTFLWAKVLPKALKIPAAKCVITPAGLGMESKPGISMHCRDDAELKAWHLGLKKITYVSANMPKKKIGFVGRKIVLFLV